MLTKRSLLTAAAGAVSAAALSSHSARAANEAKLLRIGYQKAGVLLIAKEQQALEKHFAAKGIQVAWVEFQFGPPLLEALNTGNIDYGYTGDAPPIFAQAARANLNYVAAIPARGASQAILVPPESPIKEAKDLKGKKIGVGKASSAHNLLVSVIEAAGLQWSDIEPIYLAPADAAAAFARGSIDAWSIWDPYLAIAEIQRNARQVILPPGSANQNAFFLANKAYLDANPAIVSDVNTVLAQVSRWIEGHRDEAADLYAKASGVSFEAQKKANDRADFKFAPLNDKIIAEQQAVADRFHRIGLIPKPIKVSDIVWTWKPAS